MNFQAESPERPTQYAKLYKAKQKICLLIILLYKNINAGTHFLIQQKLKEKNYQKGQHFQIQTTDKHED